MRFESQRIKSLLTAESNESGSRKFKCRDNCNTEITLHFVEKDDIRDMRRK